MTVDEYVETYGNNIVSAYKKDGLPGAYAAIRASVATGSIEGLDFKGVKTPNPSSTVGT